MKNFHLAFSFFCILILSQNVHSQCTHPDYEGLMQLYDALQGDDWLSNNGWQQGKEGTACDPCDFNGATWDFVFCKSGRVSGFSLSYNNLNGTVPDVDLSEIETFFIFDNDSVVGISNFSKMPNLTTLDISGTGLTGQLPDFRFLTSLEKLKLSSNEITGTIPQFNLPNLEEVVLRRNNISGTIPNFNLPSLVTFNCLANNLIGEIPDFSGCPNLIAITCNENSLTGKIPDLSYKSFLGNVTIFASNNNLIGCYPEYLCDLAAFSFVNNDGLPNYGSRDPTDCSIDLQLNEPCSPENGQYGYIDENCDCVAVGCDYFKEDYDALMELYDSTNGPDWSLQLGWQAGFDGQNCAPCQYNNSTWYGVKCRKNRVIGIDLDGDPSFTLVGVGGNNMNGVFPKIKLDSLVELYLDENGLQGTLENFSDLTNLRTLIISKNQLTGSLSAFSSFPEMRDFRASFNLFNGPLPDFSNADSLQVFTAAYNDFEGCIPESLCDIPLYDVEKNPKLPWEGDLNFICGSEMQIGAPCNLEQEDFYINENCECVLLSSLEEESEIQILVYPQPSSDFIKIQCPFSKATFMLYDREGRKVLESRSYEIDISALDSGLYYLNLIDEQNNFSHTTKVIKI